MLNLTQIEKHYPEYLRPFKKNILREYLQYKILEIIFNSELSYKLSFLGGTALRIVYGNARFSEGLDFDNFNLDREDFKRLANEIETGLKRLGYNVEIRNIFKDAFHCHIKFPKLLFENELSGFVSEKMVIQIDTEPHNFSYKPDRKILNKFDVFSTIFTTPSDILLAQKIYAVLNRKRAKGRDFFDIIFLLQNTKPNYNYLKLKIGVEDPRELKKNLIAHISGLNFKNIVKDVEPFLFNPDSSKKIELFGEYLSQVEL